MSQDDRESLQSGEQSVENAPTFSVKEFTEKLNNAFRRIKFPQRLAITGELTNLWIAQEGYASFNLREGKASLACFAASKDVKNFPPLENGSSVTAYGSVRLYTDKSQYQLFCEHIELGIGLGPLYAEFFALKARFEREGLFDENRKQKIPRYPLHVTLVSAEDGRGAEDFWVTMQRDVPWIKLSLIETRVQGPGAEIDIADAIERAVKLKADIIVLARGGGSFEELFPFNREPVVRAVFHATVPVITAIAHTRDKHLVDYAADREFGSPSLAAEFIVKRWMEGCQRLRYLDKMLSREIEDHRQVAIRRVGDTRRDLVNSFERYVRNLRDLLYRLERKLQNVSPGELLGKRQARLAELSSGLERQRPLLLQLWQQWLEGRMLRLERLQENRFDRWRRTIERAEFELDKLNPEAPLERGYAILTHKGRTIRDTAALSPGEEIAAKLYRGTLKARVESLKHE